MGGGVEREGEKEKGRVGGGERHRHRKGGHTQAYSQTLIESDNTDTDRHSHTPDHMPYTSLLDAWQ